MLKQLYDLCCHSCDAFDPQASKTVFGLVNNAYKARSADEYRNMFSASQQQGITSRLLSGLAREPYQLVCDAMSKPSQRQFDPKLQSVFDGNFDGEITETVFIVTGKWGPWEAFEDYMNCSVIYVDLDE